MKTITKIPNRLATEKSPYLLQHAHNPVDWFPWSEEAFDKAKNEDKPVFLSVGYSTCHWCHVMERESFEDTDPRQKTFFAGTYFPKRSAMGRPGLIDGKFAIDYKKVG